MDKKETRLELSHAEAKLAEAQSKLDAAKVNCKSEIVHRTAREILNAIQACDEIKEEDIRVFLNNMSFEIKSLYELDIFHNFHKKK